METNLENSYEQCKNRKKSHYIKCDNLDNNGFQEYLKTYLYLQMEQF